MFKDDDEFEIAKSEYMGICQKFGLDIGVSKDWTFDSALGVEFCNKEPTISADILRVESYLLARMDDCDGSGHKSGLVIIRLRNSDPIN